MLDKQYKGMSVSVWIWVIGGLIVAILTFTAAFYNLVQIGATSSRNKVVDRFTSLTNTANLYCNKAEGSLVKEELKISGVRAIYATNTRQNPDPKVPQYISQSKSSSGKYLCLKFKDTSQPYKCVKLQCKVKTTYMGTPLKGTDMYILGGKDGTYEFEITIRRAEEGVEIKANHVP